MKFAAPLLAFLQSTSAVEYKSMGDNIHAVAPCTTFNRSYNVQHYCEGTLGSLNPLCAKYKYAHEFSLSPNQSCSIGRKEWQDFEYTSHCTETQLQANYWGGTLDGNGDCKVTTKDIKVASDVSTADKCDLQIIVRTFDVAPASAMVNSDCFFFKVYANNNGLLTQVSKMVTILGLAAIAAN